MVKRLPNQLVVSTKWTIVLVIGTVLSPIVVALINQAFSCMFQKQRMIQARFDKYYSHEAELFDAYLRQTIVVERERTDENCLLLLEYYSALLPYLPSSASDALKTYTLHLVNGKKTTAQDVAAYNTFLIHFTQALDPQQRKLKWSKWRKKWTYKG